MPNDNSGWDMGSLFGTPDVSKSQDDSSSDSDKNQNKNEIPITDRDEAMSFAYRELGKLMRNDGHQIELKVIGNINYRVGAWIRVFLPSFNEDCMMFISKAKQESSADSEWITSLTLVDYPPSISKGKSNASDSSLEETNTDSSGSEDDSPNSDSPNSDSKLWTELSNIVWKYYPRSTDKDSWIRKLRSAESTKEAISKIVNKMGGDKNKRDKVVNEVLDAKKRSQNRASQRSGGGSSSLPQSSAPKNSHYQRNQVSYNPNQSQYYIKRYFNR